MKLRWVSLSEVVYMAASSLQPPSQGISVIVAHLALKQNEVVQSHHPLPDRLADIEKRERDESDA